MPEDGAGGTDDSRMPGARVTRSAPVRRAGNDALGARPGPGSHSTTPTTKDSTSMRKAFHEELDRVAETLVEMSHLASSAMDRATTALLDADIHLADSVIAADAEIDARRAELDLMSFDLLARQQPVATDLRVIVTSMRMSNDIERMGDLARHVAKVARLRYPASAVPASSARRSSRWATSPNGSSRRRARSSPPATSRRPTRSSATTTRWTTSTASSSPG